MFLWIQQKIMFFMKNYTLQMYVKSTKAISINYNFKQKSHSYNALI